MDLTYASLFSLVLGGDLQLRLPEIVRIVLTAYRQRAHEFQDAEKEVKMRYLHLGRQGLGIGSHR